MARPIEDTPILRGEYAVKFMETWSSMEPETAEERAQRLADYEWALGALERGKNIKLPKRGE